MTAFRVVLMFIFLQTGHAGAAEVAPELWDRPRSAQTIMAQPAVRQAVLTLQSRSDARLQIVHGPRQDAQLLAEELRAWLVALAVEGARVRLRADPAATTIRLEISD